MTTGKERDAETGLDYFGARYFSGAQGRFTSPDPLMASARISNPQAWNRYAYTYNNPLRYVDPNGKAPSDVLGMQISNDIQRDAQAVRDGRMTKQEFDSRLSARGEGALVGAVGVAAAVGGPGLAAAARGIFAWLLGHPAHVQEGAASVAEGLSNAPPGSLTGNLARLSASELSTGTRFAEQSGLQLTVIGHVGEEFVDAAGKTYDAMGQPNAYKFWNPGQFLDSITDHLNKSNDYTIIDLSGASSDQINVIKNFVGGVDQALQDKIKYVK